MEKSQTNRIRIHKFCHQEYLDRRQEITIEKLGAMEAAILLSIIESCGAILSKKNVILQPIGSSGIPLTTSRLFSEEIVQIATEENFISPSPDAPEHAFKLSKIAFGYHISKMEWVLHHNNLNQLRQWFFEALKEGQWNFDEDEKFRSLIQCIAMEEAHEHLCLFLSDRNLPNPEFYSSKSMIRELLSTYSLGQCSHIFWMSAAYAVDFQARSNVSSHHASNLAIQHCRKLAEKGESGKIEIKAFCRNEYTQRSMISIVTDEILLGAGDQPFLERIPFKKNEVIETVRNDIEPIKLSAV